MSGQCIFGCGGTFDKVYNPVRETMGFDGTSAVPTFLRDARIRGWEYVQLFQMDSLDIQSSDIRRIAEEIACTRGRAFVVVHGTSRMVDSARFVAESVTNRTVVFTGALTPYRYWPIEAAANLSGALLLAAQGDCKTHIFMHGRAYDPAHCRKDPTSGMFVEVSGASQE